MKRGLMLILCLLVFMGQSVEWSIYYSLDLNKYQKMFSTDWDSGSGIFSAVVDTTYASLPYTIYLNSSSSSHVALDVYKITDDFNIDSFNFRRHFKLSGSSKVFLKIKNITRTKQYIDSFKVAGEYNDTLNYLDLDSLNISYGDTIVVQFVFKVNNSADTIRTYNYEFYKFGGK